MLEAGKFYELPILRITASGAFLDDGGSGILLPGKYLKKEWISGTVVSVFVYHDSEGRLVATTEKPLATVGEFAYLKVESLGKYGAYLNWGLPKDMFVPHSQQRQEMQAGKKYLVYIYRDEKTGRLAATEYFNQWLKKPEKDLRYLQEVELIVLRKSPLGYQVIINNQYEGLIHSADAYTDLKSGQKLDGFVKNIREDGKVDVVPGKAGYEKVDDFTTTILEELRKANGVLPYNDKSAPEDIHAKFGVSKKTFKQALGALYKQRKIEMLEAGIKLAED